MCYCLLGSSRGLPVLVGSIRLPKEVEIPPIRRTLVQGIQRTPYNARTAAVFAEVLRIWNATPKVADTWDGLVAQSETAERCLQLMIRETKMLDYENHALRERLDQESIAINFKWPQVRSDDEIVSNSITYLDPQC
jgi:hypothetical protein